MMTLNKVKAFTIFQYVVEAILILYSGYRGTHYLIKYIDNSKTSNLVYCIIFYVILVVSLIEIIFLIKKSIYKSKFTHNDFQ